MLPALLIVASVAHSRAQSLPDGFTDVVLAGGFTDPVGLAHLPDGRILVVEQTTGLVKVVASNQVGIVGNVPAAAGSGERGLLGIAVDPDWPARPYVYVQFSDSVSSTIRVALLEISGALTDPGSSQLAIAGIHDVLASLPDQSPLHNGGTLRFGPDGFLYVSLGDDFDPCAAQDPGSLVGCILRLDVSALPYAGGGPPPLSLLAAAGNPFNGSDAARLAWVHGLRNPFRFQIDSAGGALLVADVGNASYEEIDLALGGGENFGWPLLEGPDAFMACAGAAGFPLFTPPLVAISRTQQPGPAAIVAMAVYRNPPAGAFAFGPEYEQSFFWVDYFAGKIRRLAFDGQGWSPAAAVLGQPTPDDWAVGYSSVSDAAVAPDGSLQYIRRATSELRAIRRAPPAAALQIVSGDGQAGNAGRDLLQPLVVRLLDGAGLPIAGAPVTFIEASGLGQLGPQPVVTDASGLAATTYTLPASYGGDPSILVTAPPGASSAFSVRWRGLVALVVPGGASHSLYLGVVHSQTDSPFTFAAEIATGITYSSTPVGDIATAILAPHAGLLLLDGMGLVQASDPQYRTGITSPTWTSWFADLPLVGNLSVTCQAYALDTSLLPGLDAVLISNAVTLVLP